MSKTNRTISFKEKRCKGCNRLMAPELPAIGDLAKTDEKVGIRCAECSKINECEKQGSMG
jgi:RNase P subunit RPR2